MQTRQAAEMKKRRTGQAISHGLSLAPCCGSDSLTSQQSHNRLGQYRGLLSALAG